VTILPREKISFSYSIAYSVNKMDLEKKRISSFESKRRKETPELERAIPTGARKTIGEYERY